ncbi:hypothetical protein KCP69_19110 [Salmonella enterica subsp. enterica]|nr:hypothetical protein KCP69_19110 [Salmonella enterica subsp. enterica]
MKTNAIKSNGTAEGKAKAYYNDEAKATALQYSQQQAQTEGLIAAWLSTTEK